ncbi:hypothetical protein RhiLY_11788 [Ceratobasidium sp. AG-Ba]|nr:hypothetical protein RhiLY_11788 [Ceratobasidium sp. AG-Ba]
MVVPGHRVLGRALLGRPSFVGVVRSPDVGGSQPPPPAYVPGPGGPLLPGPPQKPRQSVARRFFTAFAVAWIIVLAFNFVVRTTFDYADSYEWDNNPLERDGKVLTCDTHWSTSDAPQDFVQPLDMASQMTFPTYPVYNVTESFDLPANAPLHYLIARGSLLGGAAIIRGVEGADPNLIKVDVTIWYSSRDALSRANVCKLQKPEGGMGIGIFTPRNRFEWGNKDMRALRVQVTVSLPASRDSLLRLNGFETNLPNFRHKFERLGDRVQIDHLSVQASNGNIESDSLYFSQGSVKTSNGRISGQYNATESLLLQTSNGAVDVDVGLTNDDTHRASILEIQSSNGRIEPRISLLTTHDQRPQPKGGHFSVKLKTSNGRLDVKFPTAPVDSLLDFTAKTSNAIADVSLHNSFEGSFVLQTSNGRAEVDEAYVSDPTGRGLRRDVEYIKRGNTHREGTIVWTKYGRHESPEMGKADIRTTNGVRF